jgi:hypothetical protein
MTKRLALLMIMAIALAGCDEIVAGPYAAPVIAPVVAVPATMRPADPASARIYFLRDYDASGTTQWTDVSLNGKPVGHLGQGGYFYRDVPPDTYTVTVRSEGIHSDQFSTMTVARGSTTFVQIYSIDFYAAQSTTSPFSYNGPATFANIVVAPRLAMARMTKLHPQE